MGATQAFAAPPAPAPAGCQTTPSTAAEQALSEAENLREAKKSKEALSRAREARELARQDESRETEVKALLLIGRLLESRQSNDGLIEVQETIELARSIKDPASEAIALNYLGLIHLRLDKVSLAVDSFQRALPLWEAVRAQRDKDTELARQADGEFGTVLLNLGELHRQRGELGKALEYFDRALPLLESADDGAGQSTVLNGKAAVYLMQGESDRAIEAFLRAIKLAHGEGPQAEASAVNNLALVKRRRGELRDALEFYHRAIQLNLQAGNTSDAARAQSHLGAIYLDLGQPDEALKQSLIALEEFRRIKSAKWEAIVLANIGRVYLTLGDAPAASEQFEQALAVGRTQEEKDKKTEARALHGIGMSRAALGQTAEAIRAFEEALPLRRGAKDGLGEADTLVKLGMSHHAAGDLERAALHLAAAEKLAESLEARVVQSEALLELARIARDREDLQEALPRIEESLRLLEAVRSNVAGDWLRSSFFAVRRPHYEFYVDLLMRLDERFPGQGYAARAFAASEMARARSLLDLLAEGRLDLTRGIDPELKRQEREITARLNQIQAALIDQRATASNPEAIAALTQRLEAAEDERRQLEQRIIAKNPLYAQIRYPKPLTLGDVQQHLNAETALLEYFLGPEGSYLFVVSREGLITHRLPDQVEIENRVEKLRERLRKDERATLGAYRSEAYQIYQDLVAPARAAVAGKRLVIVADGALQLLPFEALLTSKGTGQPLSELPYLLREHSVSYVPSASVLSSLSRPKDNPPANVQPVRVLAFADPVYGPEGDGQSSPLTRLEGTEREVAEIERLYPQNEVLVYRREQATEQNVRAGPTGWAQRIHFATHGYFDEKRPEYSGLWLARAEGSDSLLQVFEIFDLELNADLVVLSACETGLGKNVIGEGLIGITRAFLYAGVPSVVVSLWRVSDSSASVLMPDFYRMLDGSGDKAEALRRAKLAMIDKKRFAHPYHWAPFILIGRPDSVSAVTPGHLASP